MKYRVHLYKYTSSIFDGDEYRIIEAYSAADIQPMIDAEAKNSYYARIEVRRIEVVDPDKTPVPPANEQLTREILLRMAESLDRIANALEPRCPTCDDSGLIESQAGKYGKLVYQCPVCEEGR